MGFEYIARLKMKLNSVCKGEKGHTEILMDQNEY